MSILPLSLENAHTRARGKTLVGPLSLRIQGQGITVIMGPNGAGKTSLLRLMHGLARLHGGRITWAQDLETARRKQGFVFQKPVMLRRTVRENLTYVQRIMGVDRRAADRVAADWAARFGLTAVLDQRAGGLSGGEQQKLALARALVRQPEILFLDEPCASLDGHATRDIETLLRDTAHSGVRIVMSTHDIGQARRLAADVVFLAQGKLCEHSPAPAFFTAPQSAQARAYLNGEIVT